MSFPGVEPTMRLRRRASAPYFSIMSSGSIHVSGLDVLSFMPLRSRISPWRYTVLNGIDFSSL